MLILTSAVKDMRRMLHVYKKLKITFRLRRTLKNHMEKDVPYKIYSDTGT